MTDDFKTKVQNAVHKTLPVDDIAPDSSYNPWNQISITKEDPVPSPINNEILDTEGDNFSRANNFFQERQVSPDYLDLSTVKNNKTQALKGYAQKYQTHAHFLLFGVGCFALGTLGSLIFGSSPVKASTDLGIVNPNAVPSPINNEILDTERDNFSRANNFFQERQASPDYLDLSTVKNNKTQALKGYAQKYQTHAHFLLFGVGCFALGTLGSLIFGSSPVKASTDLGIVNPNAVQVATTTEQAAQVADISIFDESLMDIYKNGSLNSIITKNIQDLGLVKNKLSSFQLFEIKTQLLNQMSQLEATTLTGLASQKYYSLVANEIYKNLNQTLEGDESVQKNVQKIKIQNASVLNSLYVSNQNLVSILSSDFSQDTVFVSILAKYKDVKNFESLSYFIYLNYLLSKVDTGSDLEVILLKSKNISSILKNFDKNLTAEEKVFLVSELSKLTEDLQLKSSTLTSDQKFYILSEIAENTATLKNFKGNILNKDVTQTFKNAYISLGQNQVPSVAKIFVNINYANYLFIQNNKKVGPNIRLVLNEIEKDVMSLSTQSLYGKFLQQYFAGAQNESGSFDKNRLGLIEIASQDKVFKAFLLKMGLKL